MTKIEARGIDIGLPGEPLNPTIEALAELGVHPYKFSISRWRRGIGGGELEDKVTCAKKLTEDDASNKNQNYLKIVQSGLRVRKFQQVKQSTGQRCYSSASFTLDIAEEIGVDRWVVNRGFQAMRAEAVLSNDQLGEKHKALFIEVANDFIDGYQSFPPSMRTKLTKQLDDEWNRTVPDFYRLLYQNPNGLRTWVPYEVAFFESYYQGAIIDGSHLSELDKLVLTAYIKGAEFSYIVDQVRNATHVGLNLHTLTQHRNLLVHGNAINPDWKRS